MGLRVIAPAVVGHIEAFGPKEIEEFVVVEAEFLL
jgi:hypothetical protein